MLAHATWFEESTPPYDWDFASEPATLALLALALVATAALRMAARWFGGVDVAWLARMAPFMPFAIRMHLAVSLVGMLSFGWYLSPNMQLDRDPTGVLLGLVVALAAIGMATGWHARRAAMLLILAGPLGLLEFGIVNVVQRLDLLGLAVFVLVLGPGRWSADFELGRAGDSDGLQVARGVWALRIATGIALIIVAFVEKLANPELAQRFLDGHPRLNLVNALDLPISELDFIRTAGAVEVLFGLLLISGAVPQLLVVVIGVPFNATLFYLGAAELVGHLPVYGAMLMLLVYGSHPQLRPLVPLAWPSATRVRRAEPGRE